MDLFYEDIGPNRSSIEINNNDFKSLQQPDQNSSNKVILTIEHQPQTNGYKHRYLCEDIEAPQICIKANHNNGYPTLKIENLDRNTDIGPNETVKVEVSLSTYTFRLHPYLLKSNSKNRLELSKNDLLKGKTDSNLYRYYYNVDLESNECVLDGLNIIQVPEYMILEAYEQYYYKQEQVNRKEFKDPVKFIGKTQMKKMGDLNVCRLKFQLVAYNEATKEFCRYLTTPVYSDPIYDIKNETLLKKSNDNYLLSSKLRIIRCSRIVGNVDGNEEVILLTNELNLAHDEAIEIEFYQTENNMKIWEDRIKVRSESIYNKCAILFTTPKYNYKLVTDKQEKNASAAAKSQDLLNDHPIKVFFRISNGKEVSVEWPFYYTKSKCTILDGFNREFLNDVYNDHIVSLNKKIENKKKCEDKSKEKVKTEELDDEEEDDESESEDEEKKVSTTPASVTPAVKSTANTTEANQLRTLVADRKKKMNALVDRTAAALIEVAQSRSLHKLLKTQRYLLNTQNDEGNTALHLAILNGNFDLLEIFVDCALTIPHYNIINVKNNYQLTPLLLAAHLGESEVCDFLLEANSILSDVDLKGNNCFHIACKRNDLKLIKVLTNHIKRYFEKAGIINVCNYEGETALQIAVKQNSYEIVEELIYVQSCRIEEKNKRNGMNALHYSTVYNYLHVSRLLLEYVSKCDQERNIKLMPDFIDAQANNGCTPLHMAIANKNYLIVRLLLKYNANLYIQSVEFVHSKCDVNQNSISLDLKQTPEVAKQKPFEFLKPVSTAVARKQQPTHKIDILTEEKMSSEVIDSPMSDSIKQKFDDSNSVLLKHNFDAYYYAAGDKLMLDVLRNEKYVPKKLMNQIFRNEYEKKKQIFAKEKQLECDRLIGVDGVPSGNFDFINYFERKLQTFNPSFKFNTAPVSAVKRTAADTETMAYSSSSSSSYFESDDDLIEPSEVKKTRKDIKEKLVIE